MRRDPPELPFTGRAQRHAQEPDQDRHVTYVNGRAYLDERSIHVPRYGVTPADLRAMHQRDAEEAARRQAHATANLAVALRLGEALKVLKGE
ncbi:hypothetical protein LZA78_03155 [Sinirhodobacter sp. WL0062]|uniref:Uncharacterized protein n=1 Tax=Rhodobacter flavimaris TaxID=2907145 RepID=A0ABS8YTS0_9RHOB|nr:hypothetical protein [Sinirhodobacter sp. WL0062]MCE5972480.1 hypothetical protein [Sinirhodobacter sp. WL0062]